MTPFVVWIAVAAVALAATACWAVLARQTAVYVTSGTSYTCWAWLAISGGDVALLTRAGDPVWIRSSLASLQFVALAFAVISLVVFIMRLMGAYPSPQANAAESEQSARTT